MAFGRMEPARKQSCHHDQHSHAQYLQQFRHDASPSGSRPHVIVNGTVPRRTHGFGRHLAAGSRQNLFLRQVSTVGRHKFIQGWGGCRRSVDQYNPLHSIRDAWKVVTDSSSIPAWDRRGLLPPFLGNPASINRRSPYRVSLTDMVMRLGNTAARRDLLAGFLDFRAALHQSGLTQGFQWLNGSFVADIMQIASREPQDIDVVTFYRLPDGHTQQSLAQEFPELFDRTNNKARYHTDALFMGLDNPDMRYLANRFAYYNGLWSHTREGQWKGYLELDLAADEDVTAEIALNRSGKDEEAK